MHGEKVVVSGTVKDTDGTPVTEGKVQVYIDDVADATILSIDNNNCSGMEFNAGTGVYLV